jgi:hypothetical protein
VAKCLNVVITWQRQEAKAIEKPPGIGVHDEEGLAGPIQHDRVRGFWPDAMNGEELAAEIERRLVEQRR